MAMFDKTFPTLDCAACILTPKMTAVKTHPNIKLLTYSDIESVEGSVGDYRSASAAGHATSTSRPCVGCMLCIDGCVFTRARFPNEFDQGLATRKPVYVPFAPGRAPHPRGRSGGLPPDRQGQVQAGLRRGLRRARTPSASTSRRPSRNTTWGRSS